MLKRLRLTVALCVIGLLAGVVLGHAGIRTVSAIPTPTPAWTTAAATPAPISAPGASELYSVACINSSSCVSVGYTGQWGSSSEQGVVTLVNNGVPATAQTVSGVMELDHVACVATGFCVGIGVNASHAPVMVTIANAVVSAPVPISADRLDAVACQDGSTCYAAGVAGSQYLLFPIISGVVQAPINFLPGETHSGATTSIQCPSTTTCVATAYLTFSSAFPNSISPTPIVTITNGVVSATSYVGPLKGYGNPSSDTGPLLCPTVHRCEVLGSDTYDLGVMDSIDGVAQSPQLLAGGHPINSSFSGRSSYFIPDGANGVCIDAHTCFYFGQSTQIYGGVYMPVTDGVPDGEYGYNQTYPFNLDDVVCPTKVSCLAVGAGSPNPISSNPSLGGVVLNLTGGTPTVSPSNGSFSSTTVGNSSGAVQVTLSNPSFSSLSVGSVSLGGANAGQFRIAGGNCGSQLQAFAQCTERVVFAPSQAGTDSATLSFSGGGVTYGSVSLSGTGVSPPGGCGCSTTGPMVAPAVTAVTASAGSNLGTYSLSASYNASSRISSFTVTKVATGAQVLSFSTPAGAVFPYGGNLGWGFSPDEARFALHYVIQDPSTGVPTDTVDLFDLTQQGKLLWTTSMVGANSALGFSPDGSSFLAAEEDPISQQLEISVVGAATGHPEWTDSVTSIAAPADPSKDDATDSGDSSDGGDGSDTAGDVPQGDVPLDDAEVAISEAQGAGTWGFGPDGRSFVFGYIDRSGTTEADLVRLSDGTTNTETLPGVASFWRFSPCGDDLVIVNQADLTSGHVSTLVRSTADPNGPVSSGAVAAAGAGLVQLRTTPASQVANAGGVDHVLAPNTAASGCSASSATVSVGTSGTTAAYERPGSGIVLAADVVGDPLLQLPDGRATLNVPDDALGGAGTVTATESDSSSNGWAGLVLAGPIVDVSAQLSGGTPVGSFVDDPKVTVPYYDSELDPLGVSASQLGLYYWSGTAWAPVTTCAGCGVDTTAETVSGLLPLATEVGLFAPVQTRALPTLTALPLTATTGQAFNTEVATASSLPTGADPGQYQAAVDWGDGTTSGATPYGTGDLPVWSGHTYPSAGTYTDAVTLIDMTTGKTVVATSTVTVTDGAPQPVATQTSTTVVSSLDPSVSGQGVMFTATVSPVPDGGTVQFVVDGSPVGAALAVSGGAASSPTVSGLSVGSHQVTAVYSGDAAFAGSTSGPLTQTVDPTETSTTVVSSLDPSVSGQGVMFTATVSPVPDGGTVQFVVDGSPVGAALAVSGGAASSPTVSGLSVGSHQVTAVYSGDAAFAGSTSGPLTQTVNPMARVGTKMTAIPLVLSLLRPEVRLTRTDNGAPVAGAAVTLQSAGRNLCTATTNANGYAACPAPGNVAGLLWLVAHGFTANYVGDQTFLPAQTSLRPGG